MILAILGLRCSRIVREPPGDQPDDDEPDEGEPVGWIGGLLHVELVARGGEQTRADRLRKHRQNARVMIAGVKVASQTPAVRSGQRIIFVTLDDGTVGYGETLPHYTCGGMIDKYQARKEAATEGSASP